MKLFRLTLSLGGLALLAGGLSACLREPTYSTTPEISFDNIRVGRSYPLVNGKPDPQGIPTDTVLVTIRYQDGDGDLGLNQAELKLPQYASTSNYFAQPFVKNPATRKYEPLPGRDPTVAGPFVDNGNFDHPTSLTDSKALPIKGTITRKFYYDYGAPFTAGQIVRFQISIVDRALHRSNVITTDSIVIARR